MTTITPKKGRASQCPTSPNAPKGKVGRPAGRKFTDYLHTMLRPEDRDRVNRLMERRGMDASALVRTLLCEEEARISAEIGLTVNFDVDRN